MFKLRYGYLISGIITGSILLFTFLGTLPDGKLHIVFCNVGQGDAAYVRFPDGRDMVVDGGPNDAVIGCLSRHMPFWDRAIDLVVLSHPQKDHMQGLISVLARYKVTYVIKSDVANTSEGYKEFMDEIAKNNIKVRLVTAGEQAKIGNTSLSMIWPSNSQIARVKGNVLGTTTEDLNDFCVVFWLQYGTFDAFFPGDADQHVENYYTGGPLADGQVELLKVPHHGSKTGMTEAFLSWLHPQTAVISVGKNSYGHPATEALSMLEKVGAQIHRTDKEGDIEVVSDGRSWRILQ